VSKRLEGLRWAPSWMSQMGCLQGCIEFLGKGVSAPWLYGATGQAFVINLHDGVCPSGPTAWDSPGLVLRLLPNVGLRAHLQVGHQGAAAEEARQKAWDLVRDSLGRDLPCYGWELGVPEYYVVHGYDDVGYYYRGPGCEMGTGPKPWQDLGRTGIGVVEVVAVEPGEPAPPEQTVREALAGALKFAQPGATGPPYFSGTRGFEVWADALRTGQAGNFGHRYNAAVWAECRGHAVPFLREAGQKLGLGGGAYDGALRHYGAVSEALQAVSRLHPFVFGPLEGEHLQSDEAADLVTQAGAAETEGLAALAALLAEL
jgi:hypothetical protein